MRSRGLVRPIVAQESRRVVSVIFTPMVYDSPRLSSRAERGVEGGGGGGEGSGDFSPVIFTPVVYDLPRLSSRAERGVEGGRRRANGSGDTHTVPRGRRFAPPQIPSRRSWWP